MPAGLLDTATEVELRVSLGAKCNPATGHVIDENDSETFPLDRCGAASWCKSIKVEKDNAERVFHVLARSGGMPLAEGCAIAAIDKDPLDVAVKIQRFSAEPCCNDGDLQPTEQCDNGIQSATDCAGNAPSGGTLSCLAIMPDAVCECDCRAREIVLSIPGTNPITTNDPNTKSDLSLAFAGASGTPDVAGGLRAVYTDSQGVSGNDINVRTLKANLFPIESGSLMKQLRLPVTCAAPLVTGILRDQHSASIARVSAELSAVTFVSNKELPQQDNVLLSALGKQGCAAAEPITVNATTTVKCATPDIAGGPEGSALVVWNQGGALRGRVWNSTGALLPPASDIELGTMSKTGKPHVAGWSGGWLVVSTGSGDDDIFMTTVNPSGAVMGAPKKVNLATDALQSQPDVAAQTDGRAIVLWQSGEDLLFQRYDASGTAHAGDQDASLLENAPPATVPAAPAVAGNNGWFVAAWAAPDGTIWSRFIGQDSGFGYNHVDGRNGDFLASHPAVTHGRIAPAVAMSDNVVAIGWQDTSVEEPVHGMVVRSFPFPE